jgi:hypothetical protein
MNLTLNTVCGPLATTGTLTVDATRFFSIEQPWRNNLQGKSCVPAGFYLLIPYYSPKHGATWRLHAPTLNVYGTEPVPAGGRSYCEIHSANFAEQLEGCIALGLAGQPMYDPLTGAVEPAVEESQSAIAQLHQLITPLSSGHTITISRIGAS